ncbi:hypothetical protein [uncultured Mucilaginibacter sp.]|uniref:hypothetical protein n=1 Tax=uncultured Mucilaginibacter sp. TaxID=797541 RepID=UPI0025FDEB6E|nr:hypothetical protein [uncultured Mucilaginibacter sp.]
MIDFRLNRDCSGFMTHGIATLFCLFGLVLINSCGHGQNLVPADNIDSIQVINHLIGKETTIRNITAPDKIAGIVRELNSATSELAYFKALVSLKIFYKGGKDRIISCNGNYVNIEGRTYSTNRKIDLLVN